MSAGAIAAIGAARVLAVLRTAGPDEAVEQAGRVLAAGLGVVELTATTPGWEDAVRTVAASHPGAVVGLGTVRDAPTAERALEAGAAFLVSPHPAPAAREVAAAAGVPLLEGALTPGELAAALEHGPAKLFPAHLGGPAYLRSVLAVLPGAAIVPTGGIRLEDVGAWLRAGAYAVGVGSDLTAGGHVAERLAAALGEAPAP
jgi:2-dehydro-3-deoxyphosphogluconate aldolase/(4S)-4-hydroxy-2-oxoglutarate aldolase